MSYCTNPQCTSRKNPDSTQFCQTCGTPLRLKNRYRPLQTIGQGGFGRTFLAIDEDIPSHPRCVIKQLYFQTDETEIQEKVVALFQQEANRLDELGEHPQIPQLLAHFEFNGQLYLVQEWINGRSLSEELKQQGAFSEAQIWQLLREMLPVLEFIHQRQIVHRDLKPANLMRRVAPLKGEIADRISGVPADIRRDKPAQEPELVLIDFGIAKICAPHFQQKTGTIIGSPEYMAPEQHRGKVFPASDLYSLGATCVHLLTAKSPVELFDLITDRWKWRDSLPPNTQVSDRLAGILDKLLENALSRRYQSARAVLNDLTLSKPLAQSLARTPPKTQPKRVKRRSRWANWLGLAEPLVPDEVLQSAVGLDYAPLRSLLKQKKWQGADRETRRLLCRTLNKPANASLHLHEIDRLPCEDLQTIDRLWSAYSQGRFGLSVQQQIYEACDGDYIEFCDRVGWSVARSASGERGLRYDRRAPVGHLPSRAWAGGLQWRSQIGAMAQKIKKCQKCWNLPQDSPLPL